MKQSIRRKFTLGMISFFVIILLLFILSAFYLLRLSKKTSAIHKENVISVICARDMSESLTKINQEITNCVLTDKKPDSSYINNELRLFDKSLQKEKNNITEAGEDKLATVIETGYIEYRDSVNRLLKSQIFFSKGINLQKKFDILNQQLVVLSQMNVKAIEIKTDDAKVSAKNALIQMSIVGTVCFLIALGFTFSYVIDFNEKVYQLSKGIKEISSGNYGQRLYFEEKDEFYEISLVFNTMAEKLSETFQKKPLTLHEDTEKPYSFADIQELKRVLIQIKSIEEQAVGLISRLEKKE